MRTHLTSQQTDINVFVIETIEARAAADTPSAARFEEWRKVWDKCAKLEIGFWDMGVRLL